MKEEHIEKIDAYLQSEITKSELEVYAVQENIDDIDEKIEWVKNMIIAIEADGLKAQLKQILPNKRKPEAKLRSLTSIKWLTGIAASLLLVVASYWGIQNSEISTNTYAKYEYKEQGLPVVMSKTDQYELYDALSYFSEDNYSTTIQKLSAIGGEPSDTISYYLGASYYYTKDFERAIANLSTPKISRGVFSQKAEWLLVLSYLKDEKKLEALDILEKISKNRNHKFHSNAIELKQKI